MKPGRALDALIAEKVMGYSISPKEECSHGRGCLVHGMFLHYSTDIAAAWEVLARLAGGCILDVGSAKTTVYANFGTMEDGTLLSEGDTTPHAICLAALEALGYKE